MWKKEASKSVSQWCKGDSTGCCSLWRWRTGPISQGEQLLQEAGKARKWILPLNLQEGAWPCGNLYLDPERFVLDFRTPHLEDSGFVCCFKPLTLWSSTEQQPETNTLGSFRMSSRVNPGSGDPLRGGTRSIVLLKGLDPGIWGTGDLVLRKRNPET